MRPLGLALLLLASIAGAQSPRRDGTYRAADGKAAPWRIDDDHGLVWSGTRYTPVGVRVEGTPAAVNAANEAGVKDLLVDLAPSAGDWQSTIAAAEANGQRYLVRLASKAPAAAGVAVDPAAYRLSGLVGPKHVDVALPGASRALVIVALKRDGTIAQSDVEPVKDGRLVYDTKTRPEIETVVLIYPETRDLDVPDLWEGLDLHRDTLLGRLRRTRFGVGLRGIVDPFGKAATLPGRTVHGVPNSPAFRAELAAHLEAKYTNLDNAMTAWSLRASDLSTAVQGPNGKVVSKAGFIDLARLVPLWSGTRGVSQMWDPENGRLYPCDNQKARAWEDIGETIAIAAARRTRRLCAAIRGIVDVPVVQEWAGWAGVTEERAPAFDGMAARVSGTTPSALLASAARAVSTVARWSTPGWLVATDVSAPKGDLQASLDDLANLGLGAAFVEGTPSFVAPVAKLRANAPPPDVPISAFFFPENAANPAAVQRLPGGRWWLPTPEDGNRLDLGESFYGYRMNTPTGNRVVMWAKTPGRYLLRLRRPDGVTALAADGSDPDPRKSKGGLTLTLGEIPVAIEGLQELPVPDAALKETLDRFTALLALSQSTRRGGADEKAMFAQAAQSIDENPGGSFVVMRTQMRRLAAYLSPLSWIEAESSRDTTFSEIAPMPGASNDQALRLRALLPLSEGFTAAFDVIATGRDSVELWVAAQIDPDHRGDLEAMIGGQTLLATEPPVSGYGAGFAWYRLGTTRLTGPISKITLRLRSGIGSETAIDALVFAPSGWRPNGIAYPYDLVVAPTKPPTKP